MTTQRFNIKNEKDVVLARSEVRAMARDLGFGVANQTRLATAISELTRNVLNYAGSGHCDLNDESTADLLSIRVVVEDNGPGIDNIDQAMQDGFTTGGSLGAGLPGTNRLVDEMKIESRPGLTKVEFTMSQAKV
ncbi:MAG: anti-sigma regulatory factor [Rhodospirillales bacterium]|nr:anti-sigma regulatory factor [Rhodospirillales bacterium]